MTYRRRKQRLLPYPSDVKAKDRKKTEADIRALISKTGEHWDDHMGELVSITPTVPEKDPGMWRTRCANPKCREMIETDEVQFVVWTKRKDHFRLWRKEAFHLLCFIGKLDEVQNTLIEEARRVMKLSDELKVMLNEKKIWFRTIPRIKEE